MSTSLVLVRRSLDELHSLPTYSVKQIRDLKIRRKKLDAKNYRRLRDKFDFIIIKKADAEIIKKTLLKYKKNEKNINKAYFLENLFNFIE